MRLSKILAALLSASSIIGETSAALKQKIQMPNSAGMVLDNKSNRRCDNKEKKLGSHSNKSGVVDWIKGHPKTSTFAVLGDLGLIGIGYVYYNSDWNRFYRSVFSESKNRARKGHPV